MIERIKLKNFRNFHDVEITFQPLTILIGANGCGKTNLMNAIEFIKNISDKNLYRAVNIPGGFGNIMSKDKAEDKPGEIRVDYRILLDGKYPIEHFIDMTNDTDDEKGIMVIEERLLFDNVFEYLYERHPSNISSIKSKKGGSINIHRDLKRVKIDFDIHDLQEEEYIQWFLKWLPWRNNATVSNYEMIGKSFNLDRLFKVFDHSSMLDYNEENVIVNTSQIRDMKEKLSQIRLYDFSKCVIAGEQEKRANEILSPDGTNFPSILNEFKKGKPNRWKVLLDTVKKIDPTISDINVKTTATNKDYIVVKSGTKDFESWFVSDGLLRSIAILLAVETCLDDRTILIENPEQDLHPWAVKALIEHIRGVIAERNIQVIISTHSDHILTEVNPEEVRIIERTADKGSIVLSLKDIVPDLKAIEKGEIGKLWQKGLLKGVPRRS